MVFEPADIPIDTMDTHFSVFTVSGGIGYTQIYERTYLAFANNDMGDQFIRTWPEMDSSIRYEKLDPVTGQLLVGRTDAIEDVMTSGECLVEVTPDFRVKVQELLPDIPAHYTEIDTLFGPQNLVWWNNLTPNQQREHIETRGYTYWSDLTTPTQQNAEMRLRETNLVQEILCDYGTDAWCRWYPTSAGFFKANLISVYMNYQARCPPAVGKASLDLGSV